MSIGAEAAVAEHDIAGKQTSGGDPAPRHLVRPQRRRLDPQEHPGGQVEQRQELGDREPAPLLLAAGLPERRLEFGGIGH